MNIFYSFVSGTLKLFFYIFHSHRNYGLSNIPKGAALIAPNHASFFDPPILAASFPEHIHFLARSSLFKNKFFALFIRRLNAHPLTQEQGDAAAFKLTLNLLKKGEKVVIFPEGERSHSGELQALKAGISKLAISGRVPIIPIYIVGTWSIWPKGQKYPNWFGPSACVIGTPLYVSTNGKGHKKEAQQELTQKLESRLEALKVWYDFGANGNPP